MKPLLFLDIDGVLNDHTFDHAAQSSTIDRRCVAALNRVLAETGCELVISSAWRYMILGGATRLDGMEYLLRTHGLAAQDRIVGVTRRDASKWDTDRGRQISEWLDGADPCRYVVVDDLDLGITEAGHPFVQTDASTGLTEDDATRIIAMLNADAAPAAGG